MFDNIFSNECFIQIVLGFTKLLIATGGSADYPLDTVEVIDLSSPNTTCKGLPNYLLKTTWSIGGLYNKTIPIICGGISGNVTNKDCFKLEENSWIPSQPMNVPRWSASATTYPSAAAKSFQDLLVIGGYNSEAGGYLSSVEVFGPNGWNRINANLPEGIHWGCAVTVNETTFVFTGGRTASQTTVTADTHWFDALNGKGSGGPRLNVARRSHGCGVIHSDESVYLVVVGGYNGSQYLDSTEILEVGANEWREGPKLPMPIDDVIVVEDPATNSLLIVGGKYYRKETEVTSSNKDNQQQETEGTSNSKNNNLQTETEVTSKKKDNHRTDTEETSNNTDNQQTEAEVTSIYRLTGPISDESRWEELPQKIKVGRRQGPVAFFIPDYLTDCQ